MGAALCCQRSRRVYDESTTVTAVQSPDEEPRAIGRVLVFVNPNSGAGKSVGVFRSRVEPQLKKNLIDYDLVITNGPNHAKSVVRSRDDLGKFNGVIILSGDGLIFEVLNGCSERPDAAGIIPSLPVGIIPSGSGNGLLSSLFYSRGEPLKNPQFTQRAIDVCCSPGAHAQPVNLIHVQTEETNIASFLSVGWGLMADIDIESERWRKSLGSNRFVLGGLIRTLNLYTYRGRLSFKAHVGGKRRMDVTYGIYEKTMSERMKCLLSDNREAVGSTHRVLDEAWQSFHSEPVVDIQDDVPEDWTKVEDDFVGVYAVALSHISNDGPFAPQAWMDDDRIYLSYILRSDVSNRLNLIKFLTSIESQKHLDLPFVKTIEVTAFRLEPKDSRSHLVVDGEVVKSRKVQAVTTSLKMAVFAPQPCRL
ncbi:hypothetical protein GCK32_003696 [Trichostrongylus colubriformis]|uniref:DAGKc domain-containing protein n=1 Tax=Trichostrongylus colubriformis TaxID=6319 RepID=A0AAN8IWJ0_TRICO